jgi:hypothetical protein
MDEISMFGCNMLVIIHLKSYKLKSNILPFGGINIMFMGSFLLFPLITNTPLYSINIQPTFAFTKQTPKTLLVKVYGEIIFFLIT